MKSIDRNGADVTHPPLFRSVSSEKMARSKDRAPGDERTEEDLPLPVILWRARLAVSSCFRENLRAFGLTEQQWRVLRRLARVQYEDISDMAAQTDIMPSSLSRILRDLAERKLLTRSTRDSMDKRRVFATLTATGRRLIDVVNVDLRPITQEIERELGARKLSELKKTLGQLVAWIEHRKS